MEVDPDILKRTGNDGETISLPFLIDTIISYHIVRSFVIFSLLSVFCNLLYSIVGIDPKIAYREAPTENPCLRESQEVFCTFYSVRELMIWRYYFLTFCFLSLSSFRYLMFATQILKYGRIVDYGYVSWMIHCSDIYFAIRNRMYNDIILLLLLLILLQLLSPQCCKSTLERDSGQSLHQCRWISRKVHYDCYFSFPFYVQMYRCMFTKIYIYF